MTPMVEQYFGIKERYPDCILFYRVGDFYEMFFEDAADAAAILDITLTKKKLGTDMEPAPLCGVPYHAAEGYLPRLLAAGRKVAICDQVEDPAMAKGLVRREVVRVLTPGTVTSELMLEARRSNYLAAVYFDENGGIGLAYTDITTGELEAMGFDGDTARGNERAALHELARIEAAELVMGVAGCEAQVAEEGALCGALDFGANRLEGLSGEAISLEADEEALRRVRRGAGDGGLLAMTDGEAELKAQWLRKELGVLVGVLDGGVFSGATLMDAAVSGLSAYLVSVKAVCGPLGAGAGAAVAYNAGGKVNGAASGRMLVDRTAARNLELTEPMYDGGTRGGVAGNGGRGGVANTTLLGVLDRTRTAMGARMLKRWIREPLVRKPEIDARLEAVDYLLGAFLARNDLREVLRSVYDLERLCGRIEAGTANGRDLLALKTSLAALPEAKDALAETKAELLCELLGGIKDYGELCGLIEGALLDEQPLSTQGGELFKEGYSAELDGLKSGISDGEKWLKELEGAEQARTGIRSLKVRYNRVQGYYIEVTNANLSQVPEDYQRRQTLTGGERFVTPELKRIEETVLSAKATINALEAELFEALCGEVAKSLGSIREAAGSVARLDVLQSLAHAAQENGYARPVVTDGDRILIVRGRHPVLERISFASGGAFVPNDADLDLDSRSMLLITGPNMGGKSTYMRQTALIVLMAQMGSFVPADSAEIGICDRIFTRIGASDNIAREQSTFLVEMNELSEIVSEYTEKSLIILDEIGRGTSTYDGLAIAWATVDYLCGEGRRARTMFATHYHELTALEGVLPGFVNLSTLIDDGGGSVVYMHKVVAGAMGQSYGIHVARMAGLPEELIEDANEKLAALERDAKEIRVADPGSVGAQLAFVDFGVTGGGAGGGVVAESEAERLRGEAERRLLDAANKVGAELDMVNVLELTPAAAIALAERLKRHMEAGRG
ncbi:MAG: DNA mismatch repair protein MutS [Clostridiales bacterium]|nr:DNA mismatch repair protein MutS [Clostridiales bacterium]